MIKKFEDRTEMIFGTGDIGINSGIYLDSDQIVGAIVFQNQEPRKIGEPGDAEIGKPLYFEDFPVVIKFTKVQSIDVLIKELTNTRNMIIAETNNKILKDSKLSYGRE